MEHVKYDLKLPNSVKCRDCVLQWKYNTGNSWGTDPITGKGCIGKIEIFKIKIVINKTLKVINKMLNNALNDNFIKTQ